MYPMNNVHKAVWKNSLKFSTKMNDVQYDK